MKTYERYEQIEVPNSLYNIIMKVLSGIVAGRQEDNKSYIKIMCFTDYANNILSQILKQTK
jgi:hypothetical protein